MGAAGKVTNGVRIGVTETTKLVGQVKYVDRLCKLVSTGTSVLKAAGAAFQPLINIAAAASAFSSVTGLFKTVGHTKDWICPDEKTGVYNWEFWKKGAKWNAAGTVTNTCLTVADAADPVLFAAKMGVFSLGSFLWPIETAKSILLLGASTAGIVDSSQRLHENNQSTAKALKDFEDKVKFLNDQFEDSSKTNTVFQHYKSKLVKAEGENSGSVDPLKQRKIEKWNYILTGEKDSKADVDQLKVTDDFKTRCVKYWETKGEKVVKDNHYIKRTSNALALTVNITLFALGIIGLIGTVVALCCLVPGLGFMAAAGAVVTSKGFVTAVAASWFANHVLSLTRDLYSEYNKPAKLPEFKNISGLLNPTPA